jgi:hypothetical protein
MVFLYDLSLGSKSSLMSSSIPSIASLVNNGLFKSIIFSFKSKNSSPKTPNLVTPVKRLVMDLLFLFCRLVVNRYIHLSI